MPLGAGAMVRAREPENLINTRTNRALAVPAHAEIQEDGSKNTEYSVSTYANDDSARSNSSLFTWAGSVLTDTNSKAKRH